MENLDTLREMIMRRHQDAHMHMAEGPDWIDGLPLGNGDMGVMVWGNGAPLNFTLDKSDLWDTRMEWPDEPDFNYQAMRECADQGDWERFQWLFEDSIRATNPFGPTKIYFGRLEIDVNDEPLQRTGELHFYDGLATVQMATSDRTFELTCFVHDDRNVLCVRLEPWPDNVSVTLRGLVETNDYLAQLDTYSPGRVQTNSGEGLVQQIPEGVSAAAVWSASDDCTLYLSLQSDDDPELALAAADAAVERAEDTGWAGMIDTHRAAWHGYWNASGISVPEDVVEYHWHLGMYLINSAARPGCLPPGLQGVWELDGQQPPWHGDYHADMNVQETFWPVYANNHPELGRCLTDFLVECLPAARRFCDDFFGWEGAFFPTAFVPEMTFVPGWSTAQFWMGVPGWLAHHMWLQWQYGRDEKVLRKQVLPFLRAVLQFYDGLLERGEDGRLHVPLSTSPEMEDNRPDAWCSDPNCDLSIIRNLCGWLIEAEKAADDRKLSDTAEHILQNLAKYAINDDGGLMLWPGRDYDESHRHPMHIMSIHPFDDINVDGGPEAQRIIARSLWELIDLGMGRWAGHPYPQSLAIAARAGNGNMALQQAHIFDDIFTWENGLHLNGDYRRTGMSIFATKVFCMEANCGIAGTIPEMLLQSWHERIRVFPAIPDDWEQVSFYRLRAEGGFLVSAEYEAGKVMQIWIEATVPGTCRLVTPEGSWECSAGVASENGQMAVELQAGEMAVFKRSDSP
ncbi:MAG: glycoside hydrolase N-terminal domain-containing protein [Armatimonadota bacterium]